MFSLNKTKEIVKFKPNLYLLQKLLISQTAVGSSIYMTNSFSNQPTREKVFRINFKHTVANDLETALDYKMIPKPNKISFFRDFLPGGQFQNTSFYDYAVAMRQRYGDICVMPGIFGKADMVMCFSTKDIETIFRNEGQWPYRHGFDSVIYYREKVRGDFFGESIGLPISQNEQWGKLRSAINPIMMKPQNMGMYLKPLQNINAEFIARIKEIRNPETLEVPGNFDNELNRLAFESVALVALNRELGLIRNANPIAERLFMCGREIFQLAFKLDLQPSMWKIIRTPNFYRIMKVQEELFNITHNYVNETLKEIETKQKSGEENQEAFSVLERLLAMDKKIAVVTAMDILFAGVDATSVTIIAILLCLAKNPEKQQKLREEILKVLPTKDSQLTENNMKSLPYMRAVIKEALRYYPNGAGTFRTTAQDIVLSGYRIPKGTNIAVNSNILLREDDYFPRAQEFLPERWLRDENNKKGDFNPFSYLPFGMGARMCIGKRLVEMELEVTIMKLLRNFEVEFHYDASKPFKAHFINSPAIPLQFKFKDIIN